MGSADPPPTRRPPKLACTTSSPHLPPAPAHLPARLLQNVRGAIVVGILMVTFISWIPSGGNAARYIAKPDGCSPAGEYEDGSKCLYTPEMRRWDYWK